MRKNLSSFLTHTTTYDPDDIVLIQRRGLRTEKWPHSRLLATASRFANELSDRKIKKGDRVVFLGENSGEWVAAFFGCLMAGVIVVPLDLESAPDFIKSIQQQVDAKLILISRHKSREIDTHVPVVLLDDLSSLVEPLADRRFTEPSLNDSDIAEIIFTSGTTAEPKGVCITHRNLLANLAPLEKEVQKYLKWERPFHPIRFLNLLPLSHVFGQFMGIFVPQMLGGEIYFQDSFNPAEIVETVHRQHISVIVSVPRVLDSLRHKIEREYSARGALNKLQRKLESAEGWHFLKRWWVFRDVHRQFGWKFWAFVSGGAALSSESELFWRRLGFAVVQGYGMTETASLVSVNHPFKVGKGSIGKSLPGQEVKLGENGEIMVRGENVSPGYWAGALSPMTNDEGWLRTGDVGELDQSGNLYFKGRQKEVIIGASGMNIYPEDLEHALNSQPEILDCAVISWETASGPEPLAVLILSNESSDPGDAVKEANQRLNQYQQIRRWIVWPEPDFPRTPTRKVRKPVVTDTVRRAMKDGADGSSTSRPLKGAASSFILEQIKRVGGEQADSLDQSTTLGMLDSLGRVELMSAIEDHYEIDIDEAAFTEATTIAEVEKLVREGGRESAQHAYPRWPRRWPITWIRSIGFYLLLLPLTLLMSRLRVVGRERLNTMRGPLLFISNHVTLTDQSLIQAALPGRFRRKLAIAMEGEKLWGWRHSPKGAGFFAKVSGLIKYALVVALFNVFPMPQKSGFRRSFVLAGEAIDAGYNVLVFPEGRRTLDGKMQPFREGIGLMASSLRVPVVPIRIEGLWGLKQRGTHFAKSGEVIVKIGEPITFEPDEEAANIAIELERRVSLL
jgi:long-chain acyl-CoA synthetase